MGAFRCLKVYLLVAGALELLPEIGEIEEFLGGKSFDLSCGS